RKIFMAPESQELLYSDKSDIWSVGCMVLDMMTTSMKTDTQITGILENVKGDPLCLQRTLEEIQDKVGYSEELYQLLPWMLKIHPKERPSTSDLLREPYVLKCLALIGSPLSGLKKTLPPGVLEECNDSSIDNIIEIMKSYTEFEDAQLLALKHLNNYDPDRDGLLDIGDTIQLVSLAMRTHKDSFKIQCEGGRVLHSLISQALEKDDNEENLSREDLVLTLVEAARGYPQREELIAVILSVMMMISVSEAAAETLRRSGFLWDLVRVLERSLESRDMCQSCCALIWSLAMTENQTEARCLNNAVSVICDLLKKYPADGGLVESTCTSLWILGMKGHIAAEQTEAVTLLLMEALQAHAQRPLLSKNICSALTGLVVNSELAACRVLVPVTGISGLSLIKELYRLHADDPEIVENLCLLLSEMAQYGSARPELLLQHIDQLMSDIKERYDSLEEITTLADAVLTRLNS
ncbi:hypothetical protein GDO81_027523, partial [Engystomops pustulosus]